MTRFPSQAKSSQSSNWGEGRLPRSASRHPPVCQPFPCLTAQLGSMTDTLTLTGGYAYVNEFEVRLRALIDTAKEQRIGGPGLITGGINFAWLAVGVLGPDWLCRKLGECDFFPGTQVKPPRLGGGGCGPCPDFASYTLAFALQLRKTTENLSQGTQKALG